MSGFAVSWLDLREAADHRARDRALAAEAAAIALRHRDPVVVDLGSGTGSTLRALAPLIAGPARWRLVDHDVELLAEAARRTRATGRGDVQTPDVPFSQGGAGGEISVETVLFDLAGPDLPPLEDATLVTSSALVDLVSRPFLEKLVTALAARPGGKIPVYAALGYDGTVRWSPGHPLDDAVLAAFNRDQARDKGFGGSSLGPAGAATLADLLAGAGYRVSTAPSPWRLDGSDRDLVAALAEGMAAAVSGAIHPADIDGWLTARLASAATGTAIVGHLDVLGVPD